MSKPPFVDNMGSISLTELKGFLSECGMDEDRTKFIVSLWQWCVNSNGPISIYDLAGRVDLSPHGLRNRLEKLIKEGVFRKAKSKIEGSSRPVAHYRFHCVHPDEPPLEGKVLPTFVPDNEMMLENDRQRVFLDSRIDDLICTSLFSALSFKKTRKPISSPIEVTVNWFETPVRVVTRSETGRSIASVADLRYFIAVMGICYELVQNALRNEIAPENNFALDIQDVHELMGRNNEGGNIQAGLNALKRLASTTFEIPHVPTHILKRFDERLDDGFQRINPLHDFSCYWTDKSSIHKKTIITFGLPIIIFKSMVMEKFLFKVNPRIFSEDNDVIIGFHLWCRRRIGLRGKTITTSLKKLHQDVAPTLTYKEFLDRFYGGLASVYQSNRSVKRPVAPKARKHADEDEGQISPTDEFLEIADDKVINNKVVQTCNIDVYGYRINRSKTDNLVIFQNPDDPYVGLRSSHSYSQSRRNMELMRDIKDHPGITDEEKESELDEFIQRGLDF